MKAKVGVKWFGAFFAAGAMVFASLAGVLADGGANHRTSQTRPISLGTSGGNIYDISALYCCSGTLGSLVQDASGTRYILSNNHVIARVNQGSAGDPVNQPGMIDQNCQQNGTVANLSDFVPIQFSQLGSTPLNQADAAIAQIVDGQVRTDGAILDIGTISSSTTNAFLNQAVRKSGRTTGLTTGTVSAIDVTVDVGYSNSCGGAANKVARYVNQIRIGSGSFSAGGDSGSLVVENGGVDPTDNLPRAVGLLFAGSSTSTIANPIAAVLSQLGVQMAGGTPPPPAPTGSVSGFVRSAADNSAIAGAQVSADTGQSAITDATGAYTLSSVPTGTREISASAAGYVSASQNVSVSENATSTANFSLDEAVAPASVGVGCITYSASGGRNRDRNLLITVRALDNFGNPVAGAQVDIEVYYGGFLFGIGTGAVTNSNGQASYSAKGWPNGPYSTVVTNIAASGLVFDSGSNLANSFTKGTDSSPASFCNDGATPSGAAADLAGHLDRARAANARSSARLMGIAGVVGHGVGLGEDGQPVIEVYLANENAAARAQIPAHVENIPVRVVVTGEFTAY